MQGMGESRTDLLLWLNDLLQLGYTKIEQCGSGAAYCQIFDSIYRDVPMSKIKFNAKQEYEYVQNFKVLQGVFLKHKIDNAIPVERLLKCKMQDNLEFLQWVKKYWDMYYPGGTYEAVSRRKGEVGSAGSKPSMKKSTSVNSVSKAGAAATVARRVASPAVPKANPAPKKNLSPSLELEYQKQFDELSQNNLELKVAMEQMEKEREFYFSKLREIELFVQENLDNGTPKTSVEVLKDIQQIMYRTEDGFEVPVEDEEETY
ncbi:hypothetical protein HK099_005346 [Clydaea vesicula]|uniref:Uncharacterized protein n=1 Tax=Clydaea vesicula TaxID=447962 RepID=A0AAD5U8S6_9FUNG|nr:hypothetical protein HK099_005346 [Clydaea vesicula]KAJ3384265.1 hypothetical protein HDU92_003653 [Lobulomyces angularis]